MMRALLIATIIGVAIAASALPQGSLTGRATVTDGDTIRIGATRIRLFGIDAPELQQLCEDEKGIPDACGLRARAELVDAIGGMPVSCAAMYTDRYNRTVATCAVNGRDLGEIMVQRGFAIDYPRYSHGRYADAQREAREAKRGIWAGTFVNPETWRRGR